VYPQLISQLCDRQFQQFLQTTLPAALLAANANTQVTIVVDKNSTYAENF